MIEINLVPSNLRKKENRGTEALTTIGLPKEVLFGMGGVFIAILILIHLVLFGMWGGKLVQYMMYKIAWQKMLPAKKNIDSINEERKELRDKMATITDITSKNAILWSQKLNILSDSIPKGIWLTKITWNNTVLTITGSAVSKFHDEIAIVGNLISNLKKEINFTKDFSSIELKSVTRSKKGMTEVADFIITARIK